MICSHAGCVTCLSSIKLPPKNSIKTMINPLTPTLLDVAAKSERFGHINVSGFINKIDEDTNQPIKDTKFVVYELENNLGIKDFAKEKREEIISSAEEKASARRSSR